MKSPTTLPARQKLPAAISVRHVSFQQILTQLGLKNELFYVSDSRDLPLKSSLLRPFKTNDFSVFFVDSGTLTVRNGLLVHQLTAGSLLFKSAGTVVQVRNFSADCRVRIFGFTKELIGLSGIHKKHLEALAFLSAQVSPHILLQEPEAATIGHLLDILHTKSHLEEKPAYYLESVSHAFSLFAFEVASALNRDHGKIMAEATHRNEYLTFQFLKLVGQHVTRERSVQFYAALLNVTPKYLSRCVKEIMGKTCGEVIDEMVILEAKVLLDDPQLTVSQVADRLHFSNPFFFSRFFKNQTGVPPTAYRISA